MIMRRQNPGLKAVVVYTNPATGYKAWDVPGWCQYVPALFAPNTCQPPTPAQIAETTMSNMGAAAASNPAVAQQIATIANAPPTDPLYCQADPAGCAAYQQAIASPGCSSIFGTDNPIGQWVCSSNPLGFSNWWWLVGGFVLLLAVRR